MKRVQTAILCMFVSMAMLMMSGILAFAAEDSAVDEAGCGSEKTLLANDDEVIVDPNPNYDTSFSMVTYQSCVLKWNPCEVADGYYVYYQRIGTYNTKRILAADIKDKMVTFWSFKGLKPMGEYWFDIVPYAYNSKGEIVEVKKSARYDNLEMPMCYDGNYFTSNAKVAKSITKVLKTYKHGAKYKGKNECYGYAEWASKKIAKSRKMVKVNKKVTPRNVRKYICNLKAGSHVRLKGNPHSLVILKATKDYIYWADNNSTWYGGGRNRVHYYGNTPAWFSTVYSCHDTIEWINKTTSYR